MNRADVSVPLRRVLLGALMPLVALALQWPLWFLIKPFVWFLFFPAVLIGAWIGGRWSALAASFLSVACVWWFFLPPEFSLDKPLNAYFFSAIFIAIGVSFGEVHESLRRANREARLALAAATQAANAEAKARESFQDLIEQAPDGVFVADRDGRYLDVNAAGCLMLGRRREEIIGRTIVDLIPPEDAPRLQAIRAQMLAGSVQNAEWTLLHAGGQKIPVEISARTLSDGRWQVFVRDISERRRTEEQLRQAAIVFQSTNEAIIVTDAEARILTVNSAFESMTGYRAQDVVGLNPRILQSGRQDATFYRQMWDRLCETGQWQGELWERRRNGEIFPAWQNISAVRDGAGQVTHYAAVLSDISALKHAEERLAHLAHHDALTGLPNRLHLDAVIESTIAHANRHKTRFALLFVDLDRFKLVNDTLGHQVGDELLKAVAGSLKRSVRDEDTVARLGGDEFVVVLTGIEDAGDVIRVAEKIVASMREPFAIGGRELDISTSLGISLFPDNGSTGEDLLRAADTALYRAKERGRDTYEFYSAEMTTRARERVSLENRLRRAITRGELSLHYQPQLVCATGALCGVEVLLRWQDPVEGEISPTRFIPIAEESGLIDVLGTWVMDRAFAQIREWLDQGLNPPRVALNLSGRQILYDQVVETLRRLLERYGLDSQRAAIELEITESVLQSTERCTDVLRRVRELGLKVAIDDFGTGYSSLGALKQLPIDALKIDRVFTEGVPTDADDAAITRAIVAMGHSLGLRVIAEGVERPEQLEFLKALGCDDVQGFLFARAMPAEEFAMLLRSNVADATTASPPLASPHGIAWRGASPA